MFGSCKHNQPPSTKGDMGGRGPSTWQSDFGACRKRCLTQAGNFIASGEEINSVAFWNERLPFTVFVSQLLSAKVFLEVQIQVQAVRKRSAVNKMCCHIIH
ncbi:UNVERIFIED_CONTAM: hypothetical protein K2H54_055869 [Gekko kuhli]